MSEPYDGPTCPFCGSDTNFVCTPEIAFVLGSRTECLACGVRWNLPSGYPDDVHDILHGHHLPCPSGQGRGGDGQ